MDMAWEAFSPRITAAPLMAERRRLVLRAATEGLSESWLDDACDEAPSAWRIMRSNDPAFTIAVSVWVDGQAGAAGTGDADADGDEQPVRIGLCADGADGDAGGGLGCAELDRAEARRPACRRSCCRIPIWTAPSGRCLCVEPEAAGVRRRQVSTGLEVADEVADSEAIVCVRAPLARSARNHVPKPSGRR